MSAMFSDIRWIFFDVGYTLLDETPAWKDRFVALSGAMEKCGHAMSIDQIDATMADLCRTFAPVQWKALTDRLASESGATDLASFSSGWDHDLEVPHDGAVRTLRTLHERGYKLGIIANQSAGTADRMRRHGMAAYLDLVIGSAESGVRKPDERIFRTALERASCPPEDAAMVGDRIDNDVVPAKAIGMRTVHVRQGFSGRQVPRSLTETPDASVARVVDVPALFAGRSA
jgi:HAD superfamily hydrolase (TIGR01662 family)